MPLRPVAVILPACTGCGACVAPCAPRAITLESERPGGFGDKRAVVDPARCTGCGDCVPACRHDAIVLQATPPAASPSEGAAGSARGAGARGRRGGD